MNAWGGFRRWGEKGVGVKRDGRARMLAAKRTVETGSVFSDRDEVKSKDCNGHVMTDAIFFDFETSTSN